MPSRISRASSRKPGLSAMEARSVDAIPRGGKWQYEPKWDGFRCLLARDGAAVTMQSKAGEDLTRYFPEVVTAARELKANSFTLDGELVVPQGKSFSFDALLQRIHPAASRVKKLSAGTPALFLAFDLLATAKDKALMTQPLHQRRPMLEAFAKATFTDHPTFRLSPATTRFATAQNWLAQSGGGSDGVIAKRTDLPYQAGNREGMQKIKRHRSADCVIGGFRYATNKGANGRKLVGSLLLGLYDDAGLLHHVGFTSALKKDEKPALTDRLEPLISSPGFTGNAPGGPSRWSTERSAEWCPLKPKLVIEVCYDHFSGERFRHGTAILRWRPDKSPRQCTFDQLRQKVADPMKLLA
ncbi:ATP-dependent DNA ligase [Bradyrhizobium sp. SSBR45G]|uniref:ATP-dependent DNA ligase n=1 Tax=unclassified Bradyrhizobium TaxID=2631580 RepID=UPI002342B5CB|nr:MULTISPECIES: ATP-dependent DNA ligase [unclassified Bradyrhizobium]GLH77723.1 ATP-dependent DNA ligase [Bradyrhizobium sp. SSBR45G]GLH84960.1 ATP-dependent DNA ligase [Bradyrhizobium sp. SSBR45R]